MGLLHNGFRINEHMATPLLLGLFTNEVQPVEKRLAALMALSGKQEAPAFETIQAALHHEDPTFRRIALESARRHPRVQELEEPIVAMLFDIDDQVRETACKLCGELNFQRAHDGVLQLLHSENPDVRDIALSTLARLWRDGDFDEVFTMYREDDRRAVRIAAAKTLRRRANPQTWDRLFEAWSHDREVRHRLWSCELAATFGGRQYRKAVEKMLGDQNWNVRQAAREALNAL